MTGEDIRQGLKGLGLKTGDVILVHSSVASIGTVDGGVDTLLAAFLEVLGESGTLVAPVFGDLGIFTQSVRQHPRAVISDSPLGTVAAIGKHAEFICRDHVAAPTAHGEDTPYTKIAGLGGYVLLLGVDQDRNTTMHTVEALLQLPYLCDVEKEITAPQGKIRKTWRYYPGPHRDFIGLDRMLRQSGGMRVGKLGNAVVRMIKSRDMIDIMLEAGQADPAFCLCDNPSCADCVGQRSALLRTRFGQENFRLTAAASAAGRYVPEMIDNLHAAGCDHVELDMIRDTPAFRLAAEVLADAVTQFNAAKIRVSSLRLPAVPESLTALLPGFVQAGIDRLIVPLAANSVALEQQADAAGIEISFANVGLSGKYAAELIKALKKPSLVFNPAEFARAGEKPFLETFKCGKLRRNIFQLDLTDATFAGVPTQWARGNAELKELVSILRCGSFRGFMAVPPARHTAGTTTDIIGQTRKLTELLDEI